MSSQEENRNVLPVKIIDSTLFGSGQLSFPGSFLLREKYR